MRLRLLVLLGCLALLINALPRRDASDAAVNATASALHKRYCHTWNPALNNGDGGYECDNHFTPLSRIVEQMRDTASGGGAHPDSVAYFYTNLREPTKAERDMYSSLASDPDSDSDDGYQAPDYLIWTIWAEGWLQANGITRRYGFSSAVSAAWYEAEIRAARDTARPLARDDLDATRTYPFAHLRSDDEIFVWCFTQALAAAAIASEAYLFTVQDRNWHPLSGWQLAEFWKLTQNPNIQKIWRVDPSPGAACDKKVLMWERGRSPAENPVWRCSVWEEGERPVTTSSSFSSTSTSTNAAAATP